MRMLTCLLCVAAIAAAEDLLYLGLNDKGAEEWFRARDGAVVVRVPGGKFARRPYEGRVAVEAPVRVEVPSFFIDKHEVTEAQFARFLLATARNPAGGFTLAPGREQHPVTRLTGEEALAYAEWAGGYIPAAVEWEKAASGPDGLLYPWGDAEPDATLANFARPGLRGPMAVGSFPLGASPYGCLDMAGNAYERVMAGGRPVMIKGGSWLTPHPLNLRVLDLCMQPMEVAEGSVGFRCAMRDPEPARATRERETPAVLRLATGWEEAVAEAGKRNVPILLSLQFDTCGQCDRTRAQLFRDPRFVAYCNEHIVVAVGHKPGHAEGDPHPENADGTCPLYLGLQCWQHEAVFNRALPVIGRFEVSPGNFVLAPDGKTILVRERDLPKWGDPVQQYLDALALCISRRRNRRSGKGLRRRGADRSSAAGGGAPRRRTNSGCADPWSAIL